MKTIYSAVTHDCLKLHVMLSQPWSVQR